jgi:hypothetical protein
MALVQVMLYREEKMVLYQGDMKRQNEGLTDLEKDDYWTKNYPGKKDMSGSSTKMYVKSPFF